MDNEAYSLYHEALVIDKHNLDKEVEQQSSLFADVGERYAESVSLHDTAKEAVKVTDAEIGKELRDGDGKLSETRIAQLVLLDCRHQQAHEAFVNAHRDMEQWSSLKDAFDRRSRMIEQMVYLHTNGYFIRESIGGRGDQHRIERRSLREKG